MPQTAARYIRALIVDDSSVFLRTLRSWLENDPSVEVVAAVMSGAEALAAIEVLRPDLVFMDLQMPKMSGLEVIAKLRRRFPTLPVVMMTAHDMPGLREVCTQGGASAFAPKSRLLQELPAILAKVPHSL